MLASFQSVKLSVILHPGTMVDVRELSMTYTAIHQRLRAKRGPASSHQCASCDDQAANWAQIHTEDGTDIWADYVALCVPCHLRYDNNHINDRRGPGNTAPGPRAPHSAEHNAKISASMRTARAQRWWSTSPLRRNP